MGKVDPQEFAGLSVRAQRAMVQVARRGREVEQERLRSQRAQAELEVSVRRALKAAVPAKMVAEELDVSVNMVHRMSKTTN